MPLFNVLISEHRGVTIEVEAENEEAAEEKVENGDWSDSEIVKTRIIDRFVVEAEAVEGEKP